MEGNKSWQKAAKSGKNCEIQKNIKYASCHQLEVPMEQLRCYL